MIDYGDGMVRLNKEQLTELEKRSKVAKVSACAIILGVLSYLLLLL